MANDLFSSLKTLLSQVQQGEKNASDLLKALNTWAKEIGDLVKDKVEEEVERSVKKMGFVKKEQFLALEQRVKVLEKSLSTKNSRAPYGKNAVKKYAVKKNAVKTKVVKKVAQRKAKGGSSR